MRIITPQTHAGKFWQRFTSYGFAKGYQFAPLVAAELQAAVQAIPLCFFQSDGNY